MNLFAKSGKHPPTLRQHVHDVCRSARLIFGDSSGQASQTGMSWLNFFGLRDASGFHASLCAAALFHDIGKANHGFQLAVQPVGGDRVASTGQLIRHEHLSGLILCHESTGEGSH